jgi:hypothetical protein
MLKSYRFILTCGIVFLFALESCGNIIISNWSNYPLGGGGNGYPQDIFSPYGYSGYFRGTKGLDGNNTYWDFSVSVHGFDKLQWSGDIFALEFYVDKPTEITFHCSRYLENMANAQYSLDGSTINDATITFFPMPGMVRPHRLEIFNRAMASGMFVTHIGIANSEVKMTFHDVSEPSTIILSLISIVTIGILVMRKKKINFIT